MGKIGDSLFTGVSEGRIKLIQDSWHSAIQHFFNMSKLVDLSSYSSVGFDRGAGRLREAIWLIISLCLFRLCPFSLSVLKCSVLRAFGARVGKGVVIKPEVKITFPWKLEIGDHVWLGEECWLLNLERIVIGSNVCISQRAVLCTGNHCCR